MNCNLRSHDEQKLCFLNTSHRRRGICVNAGSLSAVFIVVVIVIISVVVIVQSYSPTPTACRGFFITPRSHTSRSALDSPANSQ